MAVVADLGVDVEVVERCERRRERVGIRRHIFAEERQRRIAVRLRQVAEHLVVGAVLANDVEDVLDRRRARRRGAGSARRPAHRPAQAGARPSTASARARCASHAGQRRSGGHRDRSRSRPGTWRRCTAPSMRAPPGCGPRGFGALGQPLAVKHEDPRSVAIEQDAGRIPAGRDRSLRPGSHPGFETSTTVTVLLSALATSSVRPSGDSDDAVRRRSRPAPGRRARPKSARSPFASATSTTHTAFVFAHATNSRAPSRDSTIALGCSPTGISPRASSVVASNMSTFAPPHSDTNSVLPSRESRHVYGSAAKLRGGDDLGAGRDRSRGPADRRAVSHRAPAIRADCQAGDEAGVLDWSPPG